MVSRSSLAPQKPQREIRRDRVGIHETAIRCRFANRRRKRLGHGGETLRRRVCHVSILAQLASQHAIATAAKRLLGGARKGESKFATEQGLVVVIDAVRNGCSCTSEPTPSSWTASVRASSPRCLAIRLYCLFFTRTCLRDPGQTRRTSCTDSKSPSDSSNTT